MRKFIDFDFRGFNLRTGTFIETGTYLGETTQLAVECGFEQVHTIEVSGTLYVLAKEKFASIPNVTVHHGSSVDVLSSVIDPTKTTTFWLDGHFQGHSSIYEGEHDGRSECPLIEELKIIQQTSWTVKPFIVIDDAYLFNAAEVGDFDRILSYGLKVSDWPTTTQIRQVLYDYDVFDHEDKFYCLPKPPM